MSLSHFARFALGAVLIAMIGVPAQSAAASPSTLHGEAASLAFLRGEQIASVERKLPEHGDHLRATLAALLTGPNPAERRVSMGTAIPSGAAVTKLSSANGVVSVTFNHRFGAAPTGATNTAAAGRAYHARLMQVVYTVTDLPRYKRARVRVQAPGRNAQTLTRASFLAPAKFVAPVPTRAKGQRPVAAAARTSLAALTYLPSKNSGNYLAQQAVLAFQGWERLPRSGVVDARTAQRLKKAKRPVPRESAAGRRVEIHRDRGVVLLVDGVRVIRAIHTSTGMGGDGINFGTPAGAFAIYRKQARAWSAPFDTWLPFAAYWNGGWALHGHGDVPSSRASEGSARLPMPDAKVVYDFVSIGTPVQIF